MRLPFRIRVGLSSGDDCGSDLVPRQGPLCRPCRQAARWRQARLSTATGPGNAQHQVEGAFRGLFQQEHERTGLDAERGLKGSPQAWPVGAQQDWRARPSPHHQVRSSQPSHPAVAVFKWCDLDQARQRQRPPLAGRELLRAGHRQPLQEHLETGLDPLRGRRARSAAPGAFRLAQSAGSSGEGCLPREECLKIEWTLGRHNLEGSEGCPHRARRRLPVAAPLHLCGCDVESGESQGSGDLRCSHPPRQIGRGDRCLDEQGGQTPLFDGKRRPKRQRTGAGHA